MTRIVDAIAIAALGGLFGCGGDDSASHDRGPGDAPEQGAPANAVGGFSIEVPEMTLESGDEQLPCWIFPIELEGPSHFVAAGSVTVGPGMHHGNVVTRKKTGEGIRPCGPEEEPGLTGGEAGDILEGGAVLFGSSTQLVGTEWHHFPAGMAYRVKDGYEIVARMHYINAESKAVKVAPKYRWYTIPSDDVANELGPFAWVISDFEIPPQSEYTANADCIIYKPMNVVDALPHMHALGTRFVAGYTGGEKDGELWLDHQGYDANSDIRSFDPAIDLSQGDGAHFGCTWENTFDKAIHEGVGDNEMCILFGYAYPAESSFTSYTSMTTGKCLTILPPPPDAP